MNVYLLTLLSIFASIALTKSLVCNDTDVDLDDPITVQLAQLAAIKCQISAATQQHSETLAAIQSIGSLSLRSHSLSMYDVILYTFTSLLITFIVQLIVRFLWTHALMKNDKLLTLVILCRRCISFDITVVTPSHLTEYREQLKYPCICYAFMFCCKRSSHTDVIEM